MVIYKVDPMPDSQVLNSEEIGRPTVLKSNLCLLPCCTDLKGNLNLWPNVITARNIHNLVIKFAETKV